MNLADDLQAQAFERAIQDAGDTAVSIARLDRQQQALHDEVIEALEMAMDRMEAQVESLKVEVRHAIMAGVLVMIGFAGSVPLGFVLARAG